MEIVPTSAASLEHVQQPSVQQKDRELAILHAIIQAVSRSTNLKETLQEALEMVLSVIESATGWVCLLEDDNSCSAFVGHIGLCLSNSENGGEPSQCLVHCVCSRVRKTRDVVILDKLAPGCPLLKPESQSSIPMVGHVSVPLTAQQRVVGQLNVAFNQPGQIDPMDIELLRTIGPQLGVAVENARLWEKVQEKEALRTELLKKVVSAQEEERRRISRELHDELGQQMTSLLVRLQLLEKYMHEAPAGEVLDGAKQTVSGLLSSIHDLSLDLRPTSLDDLGLVPALAQYTKSARDHLGVEVDFESVGIDDQHRLPREVESTLYRIVQEALTNVARHSGAGRASVLLKCTESRAVVVIEDNGIGFDLKDLKTGPGKKNRLGIYGMEERAALVGGKVEIETAPGSGTTLYIEVPLGAEARV